MSEAAIEPGPNGPDTDTAGDEDVTLESRLRRLDQIVGQLEGGDVELEKGLALFEEGVRHIRAAEALLAQAELRVEELVGEAESLGVESLDGTEG